MHKKFVLPIFRFLAKAPAPIAAIAISAAANSAFARDCEPLAGELISAQGLVEYRDGATWLAAEPGAQLCDRDAVRTGNDSRAAIRLSDDAVLRLDENTTLVLSDVAPEPEETSLLQLVFGAFQSFSRDPQTLRVDTPYINATIEGTEFALRVTDTESQLTVVEGLVSAANAFGTLSVAAGGSAVATAGSAPRSVILARPRDAVTWGLYYPPALSLDGTTGPIAEAARLAGQNRPDAAIAALRSGPRTSQSQVYEAALLLSVGRADEAAPLLDRAIATDPGNGTALAQRAIIEIVQNDRAEGLALAERALSASPDEAAPYIALSLAQQASFELVAARDTLLRGTEAVPGSALIWARLSEIWLTLGYRDRSEEAALEALSRDADLERAHVMQGFAALTEYRTDDASESFRRAAELDQADPLPRLGLGLALIREGELEAGRAEIDAAVALDSSRSLLRSYLGKGYFEENRNELAAAQFEIAKELDPQDPTPYLYDAIRLQTENRPGEALAKIQESIARNDNRAVYRGRLQLDQDQAARGTSQGRIYEDLGFIQLGMRSATGSQTRDPANAAAHRFLADIYRNERRREIARVSELTRSQLLQDLNLTPVQPSLTETNLNLVSNGGPANAGFNEFTSLFASDGFRFTGTGLLGTDDTFGGEAAVAMQQDNVSVSFGAFEFGTDGFRDNFDADHAVYDLFGQWAVTPEVNVQAEIRSRKTELGDLNQNFDPDTFEPDLRSELDETSVRLGGRYSPDPKNDTLLSFVWSDRMFDEENSFGILGTFTADQERSFDGDGWQGEAQHIFQGNGFSLTVGGSLTDFDDMRNTTVNIREFAIFDAPFEVRDEDVDIRSTRVYAYANIDVPMPEMAGELDLTLGLSYDDYRESNDVVASSPLIEVLNALPPGFTTTTFSDTLDVERINPKVGVEWSPISDLTLRGAYFEAVKPPLVTNRTIEPTQIAGFNQYFDDANATETQAIGTGIDYQVTNTFFVGAEALWRDLKNPFFNNGSQRFEEYDSDERTYRAYAYFLPHERVPVSVEFIYDKFDADSGPVTQATPVPLEVETFSIPVTLRYFDPTGFFAGVRGTYVNQDVKRESGSAFADGNSDFFNLDAMVGYRFPDQRGSFTLQATNLLDADFKYQDDGFREFGDEPSSGPYFPELGIMGRLTINF